MKNQNQNKTQKKNKKNPYLQCKQKKITPTFLKIKLHSASIFL